jgi:hypothetical protein
MPKHLTFRLSKFYQIINNKFTDFIKIFGEITSTKEACSKLTIAVLIEAQKQNKNVDHLSDPEHYLEFMCKNNGVGYVYTNFLHKRRGVKEVFNQNLLQIIADNHLTDEVFDEGEKSSNEDL